MNKNNISYLNFFHMVVTMGFTCGLGHPIEWVLNAHRVPGGTLTKDYYANVEKHIPHFLCEMYENAYMCKPNNAGIVLEWCDNHYKSNKFCQGYFNFLLPKIEEYIEGKL